MSTLIDHLNTIRDERGTLTPALIVEVAADPQHPLHHRFEWDDTAAAHKYRLTQAAQLLRVTYRPLPDKPTDLRAFSVTRQADTGASEYVPTEEVLADPFARELLLRQMKREWLAYKRRYEHMAEFAAYIRTQIEGETA